MLVKTNFLLLLEAILRQHSGIKEFALVQLLQKQGAPYFSAVDLSDDLQMYQAHFLLFHHLYQLRDQLLETEKGDLEIHCLGIHLLPFPEGYLQVADPLREYYLDYEAAGKVDQNAVKELLEGFWRDFKSYEEKQQKQIAPQAAASRLPHHKER